VIGVCVQIPGSLQTVIAVCNVAEFLPISDPNYINNNYKIITDILRRKANCKHI